MSINPGSVTPYSYNAGFIVLSYCISVVGCWTALELLHRRTSRGGVQNWCAQSVRSSNEILTIRKAPVAWRSNGNGCRRNMVRSDTPGELLHR